MNLLPPVLRSSPALLAPILLLGGCASMADGDFPDLGPRAVEGRLDTIAPEPVALPPAPPPAADLAARLEQLARLADGADTRFRAALPATTALVARAGGGAVSSEAWVAAQTSISVLDSERGPATDALAEVDGIIVARADRGERDGARELAALRDRLATMVAAQQVAIDALLARLPPA